MQPLIADGGDMTILRHVASHAYGAINITYPEGVEPPTTQDPDTQPGYTYKLRDETTPPFGRSFIRADIDINAQENTSTTEQTLDQATNQTAGETLFQRTITRAGLGRIVPEVDFREGDLVPLRLWGRILQRQLVTAIDVLSSVGAVLDWNVQIGGQLLRDPQALGEANRDIERRIAQERKERLAQVGAVRQTANSAQSTAEIALAAATDADGVVQLKLEEARALIEEGRGYVAAVEGHVTEAGTLAAQAAVHAQAAVDAADRADLILAGVGDDVQAAQDALAQVNLLHQEVLTNTGLAQQAVLDGQAHVAEADRLVGVASGHAADALASAQAAGVFVDEAEALNSQIAGMVTTVQGLVTQGNDAADAAQLAAQQAQSHVTSAQAAVTEAQGVLAAAETAAGDAESALAGAQAALADVDGAGTSLGAALVAVATAHQDVLTKHAAVLTAHDTAIQAATDAAGLAGAAAADAGAAAQSALDAADIQAAINLTQAAINDLYAQAIRAAAAAGAQAGAAAMQAAMAAEQANRAAAEALQASGVNADSILLLQTAQGLLGDATDSNTEAIAKLEEAQRITNIGVRAAAAAGAQAGAAAMQAAMAAEQAGKGADSALEATAALADAVAEVEKAQEAQGLAQNSNAAAAASASAAAAAAQRAAESARDAHQWSWHKLVVTRSEAFKADGQMFAQFTSDTSARVAPYAGWVGDVFAKAYFTNNTIQAEAVKIPMVNEFINLGGGSTNLKVVEVEYLRNLGVAKRHEKTLTNWQLASDNTWYWVSGGTFTATASGPYSILFDVGWDAAGYGGHYYLRILRNGTEVARDGRARLGPQWPWQGDGYRKMLIDRTDPGLYFSAGDQIGFQVRRDNAVDLAGQRKIRDLSITATWLEPPT